MPFDPPNTTQAPAQDTAGGLTGELCSHFGGNDSKLAGHANWAAATYQGKISWESKSSWYADDDYNMWLQPAGSPGETTSNAATGIGLEFNSDETVDNFNTPFWSSFKAAVDKSDAAAAPLIQNKDAIVIGLLGLDCEHSCAAELHPVWAMAIHIKDDPSDDTWAIWARNWGNEGFCSQDQHYLDVNSLSFVLPRPGATAVNINPTTTFLTNNAAVTGPAVSLVAGQGAIVTFTLPAPEAGARVDGELHLQWTASGPRPIIRGIFAGGGLTNVLTKEPGGRGSGEAAEGNSAETHIAALEAGMTPQEKARHDQAIPPLPLTFDAVTARAALVAPTSPEAHAHLLLARQRPHVRLAHDAINAPTVRQREAALQAIFGNKLNPTGPTGIRRLPGGPGGLPSHTPGH